jgi:hypothetical protein
MRWFRPSIAWLMFSVTVIAVDCALLRAPGGQDDLSLIRATGLILMCDILAIGLFRILTRRNDAHPSLVRFEISGLVVVVLYALCPYLEFGRPILDGVDRLVIGPVHDRLIVLFWRFLSLDRDHRDSFGRVLSFVIVILVPAMLLAVLLSALGLAGAFLRRRKG